MKNKYTPAVHPAMPDLTRGESASILRSLQPRRVAASTSAVNTESRTHSQEIQIKETNAIFTYQIGKGENGSKYFDSWNSKS